MTTNEALVERVKCEHIETLQWLSGQYLPGGPRDVWGAIRAAIAALTPPAAEGEVHWLIERRCSPPMWTQWHPASFGSLTRDVDHAHRYPTKRAAQEALRLMPSVPEIRAEFYVAEHMWVDAAHRLAHAAPKVAGVPDGYALVPREPTEAMLDAATDVPMVALGNGQYRDPPPCYVWSAMLAAAPSAPGSGEG